MFVEMRLSHKEFTDTLQQQDINLMCFLKWLQHDMQYQLFENNEVNNNFRDLLKAKSNLEIHLIVITNGDSTQLPTEDRIQKALLESEKLEDEPFLQKSKKSVKSLNEIFDLPNSTVSIRKWTVKVSVSFLYIPTYVRSNFLAEYTRDQIKKNIGNVEEELKKLREEINQLKHKPKQDFNNLNERLRSIEEKIERMRTRIERKEDKE